MYTKIKTTHCSECKEKTPTIPFGLWDTAAGLRLQIGQILEPTFNRITENKKLQSSVCVAVEWFQVAARSNEGESPPLSQ